MKPFYLATILMMAFFIFPYLAHNAFAQGPEYQEIHKQYTNEEFGFGFTLPENLTGFLYENDNPAVGKIVDMQIHPEMGPEEKCCPGVFSSPANFLFESHPDSFYSTPVPFTGDIFAAFQGYNMNIEIGNIGEYPVLSSTFDFDKEDLGYPGVGKVIGKSYFFNTEDRYISYSILASEEHYDRYIEEFEKSAGRITIEDSANVDLDEIFLISDFYASKLTSDSSILPKIQTPSIIDSVHFDKSSSTVKVSITETNSFRSFFAINIGELLEEPYAVTWDGEPIDVQILETDSQKYLTMFYFGEGSHEIIISGSSFTKDMQMNPTSQTLDSPLQQFQSGIAIDKIQCKEHLVIVAKNDGTPACVKPETKEKLVERGWASNNFVDRKQDPGIPSNAGPLGEVHEHASILVPIFGDNLDFSKNMFQIKNHYIHFEGRDGATIHRHAENVTLGFLFETLDMQLTDECLTIPDGRYFCNEPSDGFSLKFYINGEKVESLSEYVLSDRDRILISYGFEDNDNEIDSQLDELNSQRIVS